MLEQGYYIALDYGTKKVGVAVGQSLTCTTQPLAQIPTAQLDNLQPLLALFKQWEAKACIVGMPYGAQKETVGITQTVINFVERLKAVSPIPVFIMDEHLTTRTAKLLRQELYPATGRKKKRTPQSIDSMAAALILESWFAENKQ